ncbi:hypothetical protein M9Y10_000240 [Tritrichomonas musculus]|uniref:Uncharacterized protein n=1 Tax=Tritrichomonas musculus TaxID=1915356 RepID=A0ABR2L6V4_9EUKA
MATGVIDFVSLRQMENHLKPHHVKVKMEVLFTINIKPLHLLEHKALCANKCTFSYNSNNVFSDVENSGSIFISTKNSEFTRLIEINGSSFKNSKAQKGGSIYYSLESSSSTQTNDSINLLKIYGSTFSSGDGLLGSALYLKSSENSRLFDIHQCPFDSNSVMNTKENSLCGGGIYIQSCFKLTKCIFNGNKANEGAAVYYISDE